MALTSTPWWDPTLSRRNSDAPPHVRLLPLVKRIKESQSQRYTNMRKMVAVYEYGYNASASAANDLNPVEDRRLHFNVAKNAIDTMHAQLMSPKIDPMLMTSGGSQEQKSRAETGTQALKGVLSDNGWDEIQEDVTLDAATSYLGFVRVFADVYERGEEDEKPYARIRLERLIPEDVFVDDSEGRYRKPRCIYLRYFVDRYVLLANYGVADDSFFGTVRERKARIKKAKSARPDHDLGVGQENDLVEVWHAWHLPSGCSDFDDKDDSGDGLHVVAIDGCTLECAPYTRERFPIAVYRPAKARTGFWGLAEMRQAMSGQREYERVTEKLQRQHKLTGGATLLCNRGSNVDTREATNGVGTIVEYDGEPPKEWNPSPANPQMYEYRESLANDLLRYLGISTMSAQSEVPAGLSQASGVALGKFEDSESKRGILRHRARERLVRDTCELILDEAKELLDAGISINSRFKSDGQFVVVDWNDIVDILKDREKFIVDIHPVGAMGDSPSARIALLDSWLERQLITASEYRTMVDDPDIKSGTAITDADETIIKRNLDHMVKTGRYLAPQPFDDLKLAVKLGGKYYNAMRISEVSDARLELIRRFIVDAQALMNPAAPAVEPGMPADPSQGLETQLPTDMGAPPPPAPMPMLPPGDPSMMMPPGAPPGPPMM